MEKLNFIQRHFFNGSAYRYTKHSVKSDKRFITIKLNECEKILKSIEEKARKLFEEEDKFPSDFYDFCAKFIDDKGELSYHKYSDYCKRNMVFGTSISSDDYEEKVDRLWLCIKKYWEENRRYNELSYTYHELQDRLAILYDDNSNINCDTLSAVDGVYDEQQEIEYEKFICVVLKDALMALIHSKEFSGSNAGEVKVNIRLDFIYKQVRENPDYTGNIKLNKDCVRLVVNKEIFDIPSDINLYNHFLEQLRLYDINNRNLLRIGKDKSCMITGTIEELYNFFLMETQKIKYEHMLDKEAAEKRIAESQEGKKASI